MNEKELNRKVKLQFAADIRKALAGLLITAEGEDEDGNPMMGTTAMVDPAMAEVVREELGERAAEQLANDIQKVLGEAGDKVVHLIAAVAGVEETDIETEEREAE